MTIAAGPSLRRAVQRLCGALVPGACSACCRWGWDRSAIRKAARRSSRMLKKKMLWSRRDRGGGVGGVLCRHRLRLVGALTQLEPHQMQKAGSIGFRPFVRSWRLFLPELGRSLRSTFFYGLV